MRVSSSRSVAFDIVCLDSRTCAARYPIAKIASSYCTYSGYACSRGHGFRATGTTREREREREEEEKRDRNEVRVSSRKTRPTSTLSLSPSLSLSLVPFFLPDRNPCRGGFPSSPFRSRLFSDRAAMGIGGNDAETSFDQDSATGSNFVPITGKSIITGFHSIFTNFRLSIRPIFPPILNDGGTVEKQERGKIDALLV